MRGEKTGMGGRMFLAALAMLLLLLPEAYPLEDPFFSMQASIPGTFKEVTPGYFVIVQLDIYRYNFVQREDISLTYRIKDADEKAVLSKTVAVAVETHLSDLQKIELPADMRLGEYTLEVEASAPGEVPVKASDSFNVIQPSYSRMGMEYEQYTTYMMVLISILVMFAVYLIYKLIKIDKKRRQYGK